MAAPNGIAIGAKVSLTPVIHGCGGYTSIFEGTITTNGPSVIAYHWEVYNPFGVLVDTYPDATLVFHAAGAQKVTPGKFSGDVCGTFTVKLVVTYPNRLQGQATYEVR